MPLTLQKRQKHLSELMDDPDCDRRLLFNTYDQFQSINKLLGNWRGIYKKWILPVLSANNGNTSILDIGSGGGDIIRYLASLSDHDGYIVNYTGIDPDSRALDYVQNKSFKKNIRFHRMTSSELADSGRKFDIVLSNHLLHHLDSRKLTSVCNDARTLSNKLVLFSDIERSRAGYTLFRLIAPLVFRNSFIVPDGLTSIKRSYTRNELQKALPRGWTVKRSFPFRLITTFQK